MSGSTFYDSFFLGFRDSLSFFILFLLFLVLFTSFYAGLPLFSLSFFYSLTFMFLICFFLFTSTSIIKFYLFYEASLIPILLIILFWGSYPERSLSSFILLIYTALLRIPILYPIFSTSLELGSFYFLSFFSFEGSLKRFLPSLLIFFAFRVKLPIYGLHFWLPIAHVEAPTFGSIILAGVLLKLGGLGLVRFSCLIDLSFLSSFLLSYLVVFTATASLICCFQSDLKKLVAYSSVFHIMAIPILLFSDSYSSVWVITFIIFSHGISSPFIFCLVGSLYSVFSSRQLVLIRGLLNLSLPFSLLLLLSFFISFSAPPFPSFLSEVFFITHLVSLSSYSIVFVFIFLFFSLLYNLSWLVLSLFATPIPLLTSFRASKRLLSSLFPFFPLSFSLFATLWYAPLF